MKGMRVVLSLCVLLALASTSLVAVAQQEMPNTYTFGDGTVVSYPDGWESKVDDNGYVRIDSENTDTIFFWYFPDTLAELGIDENDMVAVLEQAFVPQDKSIEFNPSLVDTVQVGGRVLTGLIYEENSQGDTYERLLVAVKLPETGAVVVVGAVPLTGYKLEEAAVVLQIVASLDAVKSVSSEKEGGGVSSLASAAKRSKFPNDYTFANGYTISFPDGWEMKTDDKGYESLESAATDIIFSWYTASTLSEYNLSADDLPAVLKAGFSPQDDTIQFDSADVSATQIGFYQGYIHAYEDNVGGDAYQRIRVALGFEDGSVIIVGAIPFAGYELTERSTVLEIVATIEPTGGAETTIGGGDTGGPATFGDLGSDTGSPATFGDLGAGGVELTQSYTFKNGYSVGFPDGWEMKTDDNGFEHLQSANTDTIFSWYTASELAKYDLSVRDLVAVLAASFSPQDKDIQFDRADTSSVVIGPYQAVQHFYEDNAGGNAYQRVRIALPLDDGGVVVVGAIPLRGHPLEELSTVLEIAGSIRAGGTPSTLGGLGAVTCTLTAPRVANLRGGPSTDDGIVGKLEAGAVVEAYGGKLGADNYVWFQLADGSWVRQDAVTFDREECSKIPLIK
ncbi:MAG: hypothetical protein JXB47_15440 [Anaerolineae bacterium]|nr:hypothetical protein [Anaerolineae bacterium]